MPHKNLRQFVETLEASGELCRIKAEVDPVFEISEIADRVSKANGPALLFENIKGSSYPLLVTP